MTIVDLPTPDEPSRTAVRFSPKQRAHLVETRARPCGDGIDGARAERRRVDLGEIRSDVVDQVDLGQQHDRLRPALPGHRQVALEPAWAEVERQRLREEHDVDVRREHLLLHRVPDLLARDGRAPRQDGVDQAGLGIDRDPVADGGQAALAREAHDRARAHLAGLADQVVGAPVLNGDAGRREPRGAMNFERGFPAVVPTE